MEIDKSKESTCPSLEDLSAWYDEELQSEGMEQHLMKCPACNQRVEGFQSVDKSITAVIQANDEQVLRIGRNCLHQISDRKSVNSAQPTPLWMKVAAGILVLGIIFFMTQSKEVVDSGSTEIVFTDESPSSRESDAIAMNSSAKEKYHDPIKPTFVSSNPDSHPPSRIVNTHSNPVPLRVSNPRQNHSGNDSKMTTETSSTMAHYQTADITLVGYGHNGSYQSIENSNINRSSDEFDAPSKIHHIWKMDDPVVPLIFLKTLLLRQQDAFDQLINENQDQYHLRFRVTDKNLQELVDHLKRMDCELLSPDFATSPGKSYQYEVDFVKQ